MKNENLIAARKQSGKTQKQIATETESAEIAYQRYEYGMREPKVSTAIRIANALGVVDLRELWGGAKKTSSGGL